MSNWRLTTWGLLLWAVFVPIACATFIWTATSDDGERLRILDAIFVGMIGAAVWVAGLVVGAVIWFVDRWIAGSRRATIPYRPEAAQAGSDRPTVDWPRD